MVEAGSHAELISKPGGAYATLGAFPAALEPAAIARSTVGKEFSDCACVRVVQQCCMKNGAKFVCVTAAAQSSCSSNGTRARRQTGRCAGADFGISCCMTYLLPEIVPRSQCVSS